MDLGTIFIPGNGSIERRMRNVEGTKLGVLGQVFCAGQAHHILVIPEPSWLMARHETSLKQAVASSNRLLTLNPWWHSKYIVSATDGRLVVMNRLSPFTPPYVISRIPINIMVCSCGPKDTCHLKGNDNNMYTALQKFGITLVSRSTRGNTATQRTIYSRIWHGMFSNFVW